MNTSASLTHRRRRLALTSFLAAAMPVGRTQPQRRCVLCWNFFRQHHVAVLCDWQLGGWQWVWTLSRTPSAFGLNPLVFLRRCYKTLRPLPLIAAAGSL